MKDQSFQIKKKIRSFPAGHVFTYEELGDNSPSTRKLTSRMVDKQELVALKNGIFLKPKYNRLLKRNLKADQTEIVKGLLRRDNTLLGEHSLFYSLGLTPQVPMQQTLLVNSKSDQWQIQDEVIHFKKSPIRITRNNKNLVKILYLVRNVGKIFESDIHKQLKVIKEMISDLNERQNKRLISLSVQSDSKENSATLGAILQDLSHEREVLEPLKRKVGGKEIDLGFRAEKYLSHSKEWGLSL